MNPETMSLGAQACLGVSVAVLAFTLALTVVFVKKRIVRRREERAEATKRQAMDDEVMTWLHKLRFLHLVDEYEAVGYLTEVPSDAPAFQKRIVEELIDARLIDVRYGKTQDAPTGERLGYLLKPAGRRFLHGGMGSLLGVHFCKMRGATRSLVFPEADEAA